MTIILLAPLIVVGAGIGVVVALLLVDMVIALLLAPLLAPVGIYMAAKKLGRIDGTDCAVVGFAAIILTLAWLWQ